MCGDSSKHLPWQIMLHWLNTFDIYVTIVHPNHAVNSSTGPGAQALGVALLGC